jgi:predicted Fe-S protein YdhL (DUF1289 family)
MMDDRDRDAEPPSAEPAAAVGSPCTSVCRMDANGLYCVGCFRTLEEIAGWSAFDDARRQQIWEELRRRKVTLTAQAVCDPHR